MAEHVRSTSIRRRRWLRQWMLLTCLVCIACFPSLTGTDGVDGLSFVTGAISHRPRDVTVQVRVREPRKSRPPPRSGGGKSLNDSKDAAARKLTSQMKEDIESGTELLELLDGVVDDPIFNKFHASAAYTSLATWKRQGGLTASDKASPVLPRLAARVQTMTEKGEVEPRTVSNVLYSLGKLCDDLELPEGLLMALLKSLGEKARGMEPQGLSNSLLACVQLKGVAPEVLTALPELAAQISIKAKDMIPQHLSNSLWASAQLKDDASHEEVAKLVSALLRQILEKAEGMEPQGLSNSLWAAAQLKDIAPAVKEIVPTIVAQIQDKPKNMNPQDLSNNLWAAAQLKDVAPDVKEIVPAIVAQIQDKPKRMIPQQLSNSLWAAARLKDDAPEVLQMVPALVKEIPRNQASCVPQHICNCLEAMVLLRDSVPEVGSFLAAPPNSKNDFLGFAAERFSTSLPTLKGNDVKLAVPGFVWACANINFYHEDLLVSVADRLKSGRDLKSLRDWGVCALLWSYDVLDPDDQFAEFKNALESERVRRKLSDSDVSESALGYFEWNQAKG